MWHRLDLVSYPIPTVIEELLVPLSPADTVVNKAKTNILYDCQGCNSPLHKPLLSVALRWQSAAGYRCWQYWSLARAFITWCAGVTGPPDRHTSLPACVRYLQECMSMFRCRLRGGVKSRYIPAQSVYPHETKPSWRHPFFYVDADLPLAYGWPSECRLHATQPRSRLCIKIHYPHHGMIIHCMLTRNRNPRSAAADTQIGMYHFYLLYIFCIQGHGLVPSA